jgi:hypothetical protein
MARLESPFLLSARPDVHVRTCCDDDIEIEIANEECRASIDERALTTHPRCHGGDVQLQLQSSLAEFAIPLHWMECRRPLSRLLLRIRAYLDVALIVYFFARVRFLYRGAMSFYTGWAVCPRGRPATEN